MASGFSDFGKWIDELQDKAKKLKKARIGIHFDSEDQRLAAEAVEYGHGKIPPRPFIRTAESANGSKWASAFGDALVNELLGGKRNPTKTVASVQAMIERDVHASALAMGVDEGVADLFKPKMKKNYRKVQMMEWRHGHSKEPRPYHIAKWDGHKGKINGRPNGLDGYIFPADKPPVIDLKTGERGYPGNLPNCSCEAVPLTASSVAHAQK